jgi:hypothetical protein
MTISDEGALDRPAPGSSPDVTWEQAGPPASTEPSGVELRRRLESLRQLPELLTLVEAAAFLHVDLGAACEAVRAGDLHVVVIEGQTYVSTRVLLEQLGVVFAADEQSLSTLTGARPR